MYTVLIIDDEALLCDGVKAKLERAQVPGIEEIAVAYGGVAGLQAAIETKPDIIFTDIRMPDLDGIELLKRLRDNLPGTRFIMLSGFDDYDYVRRAFKYGAQDYLLKPASSAELAAQAKAAIAAIEQAGNPSRGVESVRSPLPAGERPHQENTVISMAESIVREHYARDLQLAEVANRVSMNYSYFSKLFKERTGMTFTSYLIKVRMEEASLLLGDPSARINEIAKKVGYSNLYHFSRAFKNYYGVSPKEYRKTI